MLKERIEEIINLIKNSRSRLEFNKILFDILEGNLLPYVDNALKKQLSEKAYQIAKNRAAPVNIIKRVMDKLSKLYTEPPQRICSKETEQQILDFWIYNTSLDSKMHSANVFFNCMKYVAIEPYIDFEKKIPQIRVIPPHLFLVISDNDLNPLQPTVYIKIMGKRKKIVQGQERIIEYYHAYSKDEFISFDYDGDIVQEDMELNNGKNELGVLPIVYISKSQFELIPQPDSDLLPMGILIPILLTDLNFATQFKSHSILYGIDIDMENLELNPNAFWIMKSDPKESSKPSLGTITPSVQIESVMTLIKETISLWMETRSIKPGTSNHGASTGNIASGVSLMIQEMDATEDRKIQKHYFYIAEYQLFDLFKIMQDYYSEYLENRSKFSINSQISVSLPESKIVEDRSTKIDRIVKELNAGLMTKKMAIIELYPEKTTNEIEELLKELESETYIIKEENEPTEDENKDQQNT